MHNRLPNDRVYYLAFLCIIAAGAFLRLQQLGTDELWIDEAFTGFISLTRDWLDYLRIDNTPPLYYLVQRTWCGAVTCDEFGLRLSSVLAGVLFILLIGVFCRRLYGRNIALMIALIAAFSSIHVYYSQEARVYALLMTVLLLFLYLQWKVLREGSGSGRGVFLFITCLAALFLHYFSLIVIGCCLFIYALEAVLGYRRISTGYFLAVGGALVLYLPWLWFSIFGNQATSSELQWIADYLADKPVWQLPVRSITTFLAGPQFHFNETNFFLKRYPQTDIPAPLHLLNLFLTFLFLAVYVLILPRLGRLSADLRLLFLEFSAFVILPLLALIGVSLAITPVYVVGRYDLIVYPAFLLLAGCMARILTVDPSSHRFLRPSLAVLLLLLIGGQAYKITAYRSTVPYTGLKAGVTAALGQIGDGDGLLVATQNAILVWYYLHVAGYDRRGDVCSGGDKRFTCRLFPPELEQAPASQERYLDLYRMERPSFDIGYFLDDLTPRSRVVLFLNHVALTSGRIELDPVGLRLASRLLQAGYKKDKMIPGENLIVFEPPGSKAP